ncbi:glycosyltransferase family 8 protein [Parapedobacter sp. DT-150]|uniref:glycosyltransferase family 8 protein n=1 Tax=Parapedobacter sp. DT-150 TaxID=3396162 RepID=UPI003F1E22B8
MEKKNLSIVVVCDDYYAILLAAFLKSVEINHRSEEIIDVFIIDDSISKLNFNRIVNSLNTSKLILHWIRMEEAIPNDINLPFINNAYPLNILVRLFIPHFIPAHIKKIIYFDVDMIMLDDIINLWNIDIKDKIIGAVSDTIGPIEKTIGNGIENYKELGLNPDAKYFNSGLLVIDVERWKANNITENTLKIISTNKKYAALSDQYGLNVALAERWFEIDPSWSCFSVNDDPDPSLVHYFYRKPIYKSYSFNYKDEFYSYLNQTEWKGFKPISETTRYWKKVKNFLQKIKFNVGR